MIFENHLIRKVELFGCKFEITNTIGSHKITFDKISDHKKFLVKIIETIQQEAWYWFISHSFLSLFLR